MAKSVHSKRSAMVNPAPDGAGDFEQIARLAYSLWEARGCPIGSPEEDWLRAEKELGSRNVPAVTDKPIQPATPKVVGRAAGR